MSMRHAMTVTTADRLPAAIARDLSASDARIAALGLLIISLLVLVLLLGVGVALP